MKSGPLNSEQTKELLDTVTGLFNAGPDAERLTEFEFVTDAKDGATEMQTSAPVAETAAPNPSGNSDAFEFKTPDMTAQADDADDALADLLALMTELGDPENRFGTSPQEPAGPSPDTDGFPNTEAEDNQISDLALMYDV